MSEHPASLSHEDLAAYAHELRGALTVIAGYAEILRRPIDAAERTSAVDGIERAIRRADALCSDALAGRMPASADPAAASPLSLGQLAEEVAADQRTATGRTVEVSVETTAEVLGDAYALSRVLGNLIDNAAKYSLSNSTIDVRVAEADAASGPLAIVEVADRGPGIPEDEVTRVVQPFVRLERDADGPGTGLGLAIASNVMAAHGGRMAITPREGGGTIVRLELPRLIRQP